MIGVVIALEEEINNFFKNIITNFSVHYFKKKKVYIFKNIFNETVCLIFSGVGKVNAAIATTILISNFNVDKVINIGSCASLNCDLKINDVFIIASALYGDVDLTEFNYDINQIPHLPQLMNTDHRLLTKIKKMLESSSFKYQIGNLYTIDSFLNKNNYQKFNISFDASIPYGLDMELASIAQVCYNFDVKFCAIKIVSDQFLLDKQKTNKEEYNNSKPNVANFVDLLLANLINIISYTHN